MEAKKMIDEILEYQGKNPDFDRGFVDDLAAKVVKGWTLSDRQIAALEKIHDKWTKRPYEPDQPEHVDAQKVKKVQDEGEQWWSESSVTPVIEKRAEFTCKCGRKYQVGLEC